MAGFDLDFSHSFDEAEARERMRALGEYLSNKHGIAVRWTGDDAAEITGRYLVVAVEGTVTLRPGSVRFEGKDPGMLWRRKAKDYLHGKLEKYLDPATAVVDLPRG